MRPFLTTGIDPALAKPYSVLVTYHTVSNPMPPNPDPDPPVTPGNSVIRRATAPTGRTAHDGHSLTDAYVHSGPWPSTYRELRNSIMDPDSFGQEGEDFLVAKSTVPGSSLAWRLGDNPGDLPSYAVSNIALFDEVTTTEAGPPFRLGNPGDIVGLRATLSSFIEYLTLAYTSGNGGAGARVNLWSIWPQADGWVNHPDFQNWGSLGGFRAACVEYGRTFKYMADYANWKMRELMPNLPADRHVHVFPGHLFMLRIFDDIQNGLVMGDGGVPGFPTFESFFHPADATTGPNRPIHPGMVAAYGLACLAVTLHYKVNLTAEDSKPGVTVAIPGAFSETRPGGEPAIEWPAVSREYAEYCWRVAWEIANAYGPAGFGGSEGNEVLFRAGDPDPLAGGAPVDPELPPVNPGAQPPTARLKFSHRDISELASFAGTQPTVNAGLRFPGADGLTSTAFNLTGRVYAAFAINISAMPPQTIGTLLGVSPNMGAWAKPSGNITVNSYPNPTQSFTQLDAPGMTEQDGISIGNPSTTGWTIIEGWIDSTNLYGAVDGGTVRTKLVDQEGVLTNTRDLKLFYDAAAHVAAGRVMDRIPTTDERAAIRAWLTAEAALITA